MQEEQIPAQPVPQLSQADWHPLVQFPVQPLWQPSQPVQPPPQPEVQPVHPPEQLFPQPLQVLPQPEPQVLPQDAVQPDPHPESQLPRHPPEQLEPQPPEHPFPQPTAQVLPQPEQDVPQDAVHPLPQPEPHPVPQEPTHAPLQAERQLVPAGSAVVRLSPSRVSRAWARDRSSSVSRERRVITFSARLKSATAVTGDTVSLAVWASSGAETAGSLV